MMVRITLSLLMATLAWLTLPTWGHADDAPKAEAKPQFHVYGGQCSRSIKYQSSYHTAQDAITAAIKLRETLKGVDVRMGDADVVAGKHADKVVAEFHVYRRGARCGQWSVVKEEKDPAKAREAMKEMNQRLTPTEMVVVYKLQK